MVQYRKILELYFNGVSQRTISTSVGSARNTVSDVIQRAKKRGFVEWIEEYTDSWLEVFLYPEKQAVEKGYAPPPPIGRLFIKNSRRKILP